jgi:hypothetical protein
MAAVLLPSAYVATVAGMMIASLMGQLCGFMQPATKMPQVRLSAVSAGKGLLKMWARCSCSLRAAPRLPPCRRRRPK